jgi:CHAD domain-containing protein
MNRMSNISLSEDQELKLMDITQNSPELLIRRARLILAYSEGNETMQAAAQAGMSRGRARFWKRQFIARGMDIFVIDATTESEDDEALHPSEKTGDQKLVDVVPSQSIEDQLTQQGELPFPNIRKSIGILPNDSLADAGRKVWLYHFAIMMSHEKGTILGNDIEELHDMRVATRRMRSAFDIFMPAFSLKLMKRYLKGLRNVGQALGQVRDMDVLLEYALTYQGKMEEPSRPGLEPLLNEWRDLIEKKRVKLIEHLRCEAYQRFKKEFNCFVLAPLDSTYPGNIGTAASNQIRDIVPVLVYSRYAAVRSYEAILPTASVSQLHALRIEFKKFRYALEYFREILGDTAGEAIIELKNYQDHLGELHDADVACQLVGNFLKNWDEKQNQFPIAERVNSEPVVTYLAYLHAERYRLMLSFPELWQYFCRPEFRQGLAQAISLL